MSMLKIENAEVIVCGLIDLFAVLFEQKNGLTYQSETGFLLMLNY